ncbi:Inner membrane assembly complex subunit 17 [Madurella mycetomatis]|uniref:Inner membrane assembly complex subunit 17 n=1 Tax=Madurella mycetomatis TaxID=100816 RepID=A0A175WCD3_9PEZI|nr:Inner membrane assembly complex subunit 17 [Madurella mycetomatis]KXX81356.1 Inner membrane assembly complex subunit 17 [Madurella mycetomatis]
MQLKGAFYKTFTRPVAKCALLAVLTYQLVYFGWTKLVHEEIKADRQAEITKLEAQVRSLQSARETGVEAKAAAGDVAGENAKGGEGGSGKVSGRWWPW